MLFRSEQVRPIPSEGNAEAVRALLAAVVESSSDAILSWTLDGVITSWNAQATRMYGHTAEEAIGRSIYMLIPKGRHAAADEILSALKAGRAFEQYETERVRKDGSMIDVALTVFPVRDAAGHVIGAATIGRDISERRRTELALRRSEEKLRAALETARLGAWERDLRSGEMEVSPGCKANLGLPPEAPLTFEMLETMRHPDDRERVAEAIRRAIAEGTDFDVESRVVWKDGSVHWLILRGNALYDKAGRPIRTVGVTLDVTERREAEEALRASHARIEEILESIDDAFFAVDHDWRFTYVNRHSERLWRRPREGLLGRDLWKEFPALLGSHPERLYREAARTRQPVRAETVAVSLKRPIDLAIYPSPSGLSVYFRDISERKRAEEHQGLLMRELDHRVKNILATVQSIARQTLPRGASALAFTGRLTALGQAHTLLAGSRWEGAGLEAIARAELAPYGGAAGDRIVVRGPPILLKPKPAQVLAMALHELATNAAKYGALSVPDGTVEIAWAEEGSDDDPCLTIRWMERNGPAVAAPDRRGFGRTMLELGIAHELQGRVELRFDPAGVACTISIPIGAGCERGGAPPPAAADPVRDQAS